MNILTLASAIAATGTATQAAQATNTPFGPNRKCVAVVDLTTCTTTTTVVIETANDAAFTVGVQTVGTFAVIGKVKFLEITTDRYVRSRQSVAGGAGTWDAYLLSN
jgi:glucose dehydrogenase